MATIDKRVGRNNDVAWRARVRVQGQTRAATFKRKKDATTRATSTEADLVKGKHEPTRAEMRRTVSEAAIGIQLARVTAFRVIRLNSIAGQILAYRIT